MMTRARAVASVALAIVLSGCAAKAARPQVAAPPVSSTSAVEQLQRDLRSIFTSSTIDHALWSISVRSLKADATLFAMNANRMQTPASNQKVLTAAVAAERLGWDYRYSTKVYATGPIAGGDLNGDLVVVSNGDPTINPRHPDRWNTFDAWAKDLYGRGIRRINGQLIGDDNAFAEPGWGFGWAWDDLTLGYGAPVSGLQYNENVIELMVGPGINPGDRAIISVSPPGSGVILDHGVTTVAADQQTRVSIERVPGSSMLSVRGQVAAAARAVTLEAAAPNPTILYLNALREALARNGVFVGGGSLDIDDARVKPDYAAATLLIDDHSPTLQSIVDVCLKWSENIYAESMLYSMAPAGAEATAAGGLAALNDTLKRWGVASDHYIARDGSGLSRNDYLAPDALVTVLTHMWNDPRHRDPFRSTLPQAAVSGSLANRMKNTIAAERVWAKTGSMSNVRSLSGYAMTLDNEPIVFSFMATSFHVPASQIDATMDAALVRLVKFTDR